MDGITFVLLARIFVSAGSRRLLGFAPTCRSLASYAATAPRRGQVARPITTTLQTGIVTARPQRREPDHGATLADACITTDQRCPARKARGNKVCSCQPNGSA